MSASALVWTAVGIAGFTTATSADSVLFGAPLTVAMVLFSVFHVVRFFRTRIELSSQTVTLYRLYDLVQIPLEDVDHFELATGRFGIYTFISAKSVDGKIYRSSLQPQQNIRAAARAPKVNQLLDRLNSSLADFKV